MLLQLLLRLRLRLLLFLRRLPLPVLAAWLLSACSNTYAPGAHFAVSESPTHAARRRGCVDVKSTLVADARVPRSSALVAYELGNGCDDGHAVDLSQAKVTGRAGGRETTLVPYDPRFQLHAALLDGRMGGDEAVRYDGPAGSVFEEICIDLRGVVEAQDDGFGVVCLATPGERVAVDAARTGFYRAIAGCTDDKRYVHPDCWADRSAWQAPTTARARVDVGLSYHAIPTSHLTLSRGSLASVSGAPLGRLDAVTYDVRGSGFVTRGVYVGGEVGLGFGNAPAVPLGEPASVTTPTNPSVHLVGGALLGIQSIRSGPFQLRGELFGGARVVALPAKDEAGVATASFVGAAWMMEPRVAADVWVAPDITLGVWGGTDVLQRGAWSTGLALVLHTRSFDAR